jgi:hypothetical protein
VVKPDEITQILSAALDKIGKESGICMIMNGSHEFTSREYNRILRYIEDIHVVGGITNLADRDRMDVSDRLRAGRIGDLSVSNDPPDYIISRELEEVRRRFHVGLSKQISSHEDIERIDRILILLEEFWETATRTKDWLSVVLFNFEVTSDTFE